MNKSINLFILASATLHVAMLGLIDIDSSTAPVQAGSLMRISIQAPALKPAQDQVAKSTPSESTKKIAPLQKQPEIKNQPANKIRPVVKHIPDAVTTKTIDTATTTESEVLDTEQSADNNVVAKLERSTTTVPERITSLLVSDLERIFALHFYYPRLAIKRGWQGDVKISLRIEADGHLTRVRVLRSSGYDILDNAAMNSIDKIEALPAAVALLDGRSLDLVLPIEYRLL